MSDDARSFLGLESQPPNGGTQSGSVPSGQAQPGPLQGVAGWLQFFVIVRMYLDPILTAIMLVIAWIGFTSLADRYGPGIIVSGMVDTAMAILLTVRGIGVGMALRDIKPQAVRSAKRWLLLVLAWTFVSPIVYLILGFPEDVLGRQAVIDVVKTVVSFAIWYSYFSVSERVKATYRDWEGKGTAEAASEDSSVGFVPAVDTCRAVPEADAGEGSEGGVQIDLRDCPHCRTEGVLPMPNGCCPHCKKKLMMA